MQPLHRIPLRNKDLSRIFRQMADCYRYLGTDDRFRAQAYENAARTLSNLQEPVETLATDFKKLDELKGIGESIGKKIIEYLQTGRINTFEKLKKKVPFELLELLHVQGIGPSTLRMLHEKMKINSKDELVKLLEEERLENIPGFAKKLETLRQAMKMDDIKKRMPLALAEKTGNSLLSRIKKIPGVHQCLLAGSLRRKKETVGDIDIVITANEKDWEKIIEQLKLLPGVNKVLAAGRTKASLILKRNHVQVDIRIVHDHELGAAMFYFTGSKEHNIQLRTHAKQRGWKINEYGVFDEKTGKRLAGETEEEIYSLFGLSWIPPEKRTGRDELQKIQVRVQ